jgi:hypothetical protein
MFSVMERKATRVNAAGDRQSRGGDDHAPLCRHPERGTQHDAAVEGAHPRGGPRPRGRAAHPQQRLATGHVGSLRKDTVKVKLADCLVAQLLSGLVVLDWQTQRRLGGAAKRLWYYLAARAPAELWIATA